MQHTNMHATHYFLAILFCLIKPDQDSLQSLCKQDPFANNSVVIIDHHVRPNCDILTK